MVELDPRHMRNLNPTPEAVIARAIWSHEYAFEQRGGTMDFWDNLGESRQRVCRNVLRDVLEARTGGTP